MPDAIDNFMSAVKNDDATQMVAIQKEHNLTIPTEFSNISKATTKIRDLIYYSQVVGGDQAKIQEYIDTNWLKKKTATPTAFKLGSDEYITNNGKVLKIVTGGPDTGAFYDPATRSVVSQETNPELFEGGGPRLLTAQEDAGFTEWSKGGAKRANAFSEEVAAQARVAQQVIPLANQAMQILQAYPKVAGIYDIDKGDNWWQGASKAFGQFLQNGANVIWGEVSVDLSTIDQNLTLSPEEKNQLSVLNGIYSKLSTIARQEIAGQGPITDAEAEQVAKQFGTLNDNASRVISTLKSAIWRANVTFKFAQEWANAENQAGQNRKVPNVQQFITSTWPPILKGMIDSFNVISLGIDKTAEREAATDVEKINGYTFQSIKQAKDVADGDFNGKRVSNAKVAAAIQYLKARNVSGFNKGGHVNKMRAKFYNNGGELANDSIRNSIGTSDMVNSTEAMVNNPDPYAAPGSTLESAKAAIALVEKYGFPGTDGVFHALDKLAQEEIAAGRDPMAVPLDVLEDVTGQTSAQPNTAAELYEGDYREPAGGLNEDPQKAAMRAKFNKGGRVARKGIYAH